MLNNQKRGSLHKICICFPETSLKKESESCTHNNDNANANATVNIDSAKNCCINCLRSEPTVLRIPTSFARFSLRAVLKFMKLMQASNNTNTPIMPNIHTYWIAPPTFTPFLNSEYKCHLFIGIKKSSGFFFCNCAFTFLYFASFILAEAAVKLTLSFSSTNNEVKFGRQGSSMLFTSSLL